jgi:hypothetical protein
MSYPTRKPVSEFTQRALDGNVKEVERLASICKTDLYAILASQKPDHLDYARDIHRALCSCNPEAAREYRELLEADADLMSPGRRAPAAQTDSYAVSRLCQKFVDAVIREGKREADEGDVLSEARRLHATLGAFIKSEEAKEDVRPRLKEIV